MARADDLFAKGLALHQEGRLAEAEPLYAQALMADAKHLHSLNAMGALAHQQGRYNEAVGFYERAIAQNGRASGFIVNLGITLQTAGRLDEAEAAHRRAIGVKPDFADAHFNLGNVLAQRGDQAGAEAAYRQTLKHKWNHPGAQNNLGVCLQTQGSLAEAGEWLRKVLGQNPGYAEAWNNLASVLHAQGQGGDAFKAVDRALSLWPDYPQAHYNKGNLLYDTGRLEEAVAAFRRTIVLSPRYVEAYNNLGNTFILMGRLEDAVATFRQALALAPDNPRVHNNLGNALKEQGKLDEALESYRRALALNPASAAGGNLALSLNYSSALSPEAVFEAHRRWGEVHGAVPRLPRAAPDRDADRRLKVGFVSGDLRAHSVAYFLEPLLKARDRAAVEVFAYAEVANPDPVTERLRSLSDHWISTVGLTPEAMAQRVRDDGIDILIDLAGHTDRNRLPVFAMKPAPVQATWLGYPHTTGLEAVDWRLVDAITDPPGEADGFAVETLLRMDGGFLCYEPPPEAPETDLPPSLLRGYTTFGSFNNPVKLSGRTITVWADLMTALPTSRLLLKGKPFADPGARGMLEARFATRGIEASRLMLRSHVPDTRGHLALYDEVDIALDPFPYNGTTTTCEALWMGVPVVALAGDRHAGRVGMSLLTHAGLPELIADSTARYVEIAAALADNPDRLAELRRTLRSRLKASPLTDAPAFARRFEAALRAMWMAYLQTV